jgi:two-component system chemotaxis sensor kinase CheA
MVAVGNQRFAVPLTAVREVLAVETSAIKIFENNEAAPFRNSVLPIFRLARIFALQAQEKGRLHVLVIEHGGNPVGLAVDRILGQREIVVRTVTDPLVRVPGVVGATELGDGRPVLILDPYALIRKSLDFATAEAYR